MSVEIVSTVLVAASATPPAGAYDLTDLATVHDELSIPVLDTSNDAFLQRAITQASSAIVTYCNRPFAVEAIQDQVYIQQDAYPFQVPGGFDPLQLSRWPLANATVVNFTGSTHGTTTVDGIASVSGLVAGMLVFASDGSIPAGTKIAAVGTNSITLTKAATTSVAGLSLSTGVQVIQTLSVGTLQTLTYGTDYTIDPARGWLIRLDPNSGVSQNWEAEATTVQYQAGYATVPPDLIDACLRLVTARFRARGRDPMLVERTQPQTLGSERFWVGSAAGQTGAFSPEIESLIAQFRVPVCG